MWRMRRLSQRSQVALGRATVSGGRLNGGSSGLPARRHCRWPRYLWLGLVAWLSWGVLVGCQGSGGSAGNPLKDGTRLPIVASFSILGDWCGRSGAAGVGDDFGWTQRGRACLLPQPSDGVAIQRAAVVFEMGLGFETWLESLFVGTGSAARRVVVTEALTPELILLADGSETSSGQAIGPAEPDPHVWHSPALVKRMVQRIADELTQLDPAGGSDYRQRAEGYLLELDALDREIKTGVAAIPEARRHLVTTHDTFAYFARDYGFQVSNLLGSVSSEVADPSAAQMAELVERIRLHRVPAVFSENILDEKLTQQVAREAGVRVVGTLRTDALGPAGTDGETYLGLMRGNLQIMVESLR